MASCTAGGHHDCGMLHRRARHHNILCGGNTETPESGTLFQGYPPVFVHRSIPTPHPAAYCTGLRAGHLDGG